MSVNLHRVAVISPHPNTHTHKVLFCFFASLLGFNDAACQSVSQSGSYWHSFHLYKKVTVVKDREEGLREGWRDLWKGSGEGWREVGKDGGKY